jgi:hypothetical protein
VSEPRPQKNAVHIRVSDIEIERNLASYVIEVEGFQKKVRIAYPPFFTITDDTYFRDFVASSLITIQALFDKCAVTLPFKLSSKKEAFWRKMYDKEYVFYSSQVGRHLLPDHDRLRFSYLHDNEATPKGKCLDNQKHLVLMGFGKESLLTAGVLSELYGRENVFSATVSFTRIDWTRKVFSYQKYMELGYHCAKVRTNANTIDKFMTNLVDMKDERWRSLYWDFAPQLTCMLTSLASLAQHYSAKYVWMGNEIDCTRRAIYEGREHYGWLTCQSTYFQKAYTESEDGIVFSSILSRLYEYGIQKVLSYRYKDLFQIQQSCNNQNPKETWCSTCEKCLDTCLMLAAMGIDFTKIIDENKVFKGEYAADRANGNLKTRYGDIDKVFVHCISKLQRSQVNSKPLENYVKKFPSIEPIDEVEMINPGNKDDIPPEVWRSVRQVFSKCLQPV